MTIYPPFEFDTTTDAADAAAGLIRSYCGWHVWPSVTETLVLDGPGSQILSLPTMKLAAVVSITETAAWTGTVPPTPVVLNVLSDVRWSENGNVWRSSRRWWTTEPRGITITFTHGLADIPYEVAQLAATLAERAASNPRRPVRMQAGARSEEYAKAGLLLDEKEILARYRRRAVA